MTRSHRSQKFFVPVKENCTDSDFHMIILFKCCFLSFPGNRGGQGAEYAFELLGILSGVLWLPLQHGHKAAGSSFWIMPAITWEISFYCCMLRFHHDPSPWADQCKQLVNTCITSPDYHAAVLCSNIPSLTLSLPV